MALLVCRACTFFSLDIARCLSKLVVSIYILNRVFESSISGYPQRIFSIAKLQILFCSVNCEMLAYQQPLNVFWVSKCGRALWGEHRKSSWSWSPKELTASEHCSTRQHRMGGNAAEVTRKPGWRARGTNMREAWGHAAWQEWAVSL